MTESEINSKMQYFSITSAIKHRSSNEVVGSTSFIVKVESEDEVKKIIQDELDKQTPNLEFFEDDFCYMECSEKEYKKFLKL